MILRTFKFWLIVTKVVNNNRMGDNLLSANIFYINDVRKLFTFSLNNVFKVSFLMGFDYVYFYKKKEKFSKKRKI